MFNKKSKEIEKLVTENRELEYKNRRLENKSKFYAKYCELIQKGYDCKTLVHDSADYIIKANKLHDEGYSILGELFFFEDENQIYTRLYVKEKDV